MAGELGSQPYGHPVSLFLGTPVAPVATATTQLLGATAATAGFVVPAGYAFHPTVLQVSGSTPVTAGLATFNVTDNTVAIAPTPTLVLSAVAPTQQAAAVQRISAAPIAAGHTVGVNVVTNGAYLPVTAKYDVTLSGVLIAV